LAVSIGGYLIFRTVKNAGFDPDLMKRNPGLAMTKMATALNPEIETVSTNDRAGTITMRDKTTGKIATFKFDPDKKTLVVAGDDGKQVQFSASGQGDNASFEMKSADGTVKVGSAAASAVAEWVPVYPGAPPQGTLSSENAEGSQNTYSFKTADAPAKVLAYYQDRLKGAGFTVNTMTSGDQGGIVQAEDSGKKRSLLISASSADGQTAGSITAIEKK
ncbi:MAG: hypothetical protein ACRD30_07970, partial [Bryobacteraceae bacterium]